MALFLIVKASGEYLENIDKPREENKKTPIILLLRVCLGSRRVRDPTLPHENFDSFFSCHFPRSAAKGPLAFLAWCYWYQFCFFFKASSGSLCLVGASVCWGPKTQSVFSPSGGSHLESTSGLRRGGNGAKIRRKCQQKSVFMRIIFLEKESITFLKFSKKLST